MGAGASIFELQQVSELQQKVLDYSNGDDTDMTTLELSEIVDGEVDQSWSGVLVCDCLGGAELSFEMIQSTLSNCSAVGLSLANNSIKGPLSKFPWSESLRLLNFGGNSERVADLCVSLPVLAADNLWCLDLSFTELLVLSGDCFAHSGRCRSLIRLVLDGCSLSNTINTSAEGNNDNSDSLFAGLPSLRELSLRENLFEDVDSLKGLIVLRPTLHSLWLQECPVVDTKAGQDKVLAMAVEHFPVLQYIDKKPVQPRLGSSIATIEAPVVLRREDGGSQAVGGLAGAGLDQMEKEYLMALKGERDNAMIS